RGLGVAGGAEDAVGAGAGGVPDGGAVLRALEEAVAHDDDGVGVLREEALDLDARQWRVGAGGDLDTGLHGLGARARDGEEVGARREAGDDAAALLVGRGVRLGAGAAG